MRPSLISKVRELTKTAQNLLEIEYVRSLLAKFNASSSVWLHRTTTKKTIHIYNVLKFNCDCANKQVHEVSNGAWP